jgi:hypothetical protein
MYVLENVVVDEQRRQIGQPIEALLIQFFQVVRKEEKLLQVRVGFETVLGVTLI